MNTRSSGKELLSPLSNPEKTTKKKRRKKPKQRPTDSTSSQTETESSSGNEIVEEIFEEEGPETPSQKEEVTVIEDEMEDEDDMPIWSRTRTVAPTPDSAIQRPNIDNNNFSLKGHHMQLIKDAQFDGRVRADPHKHIATFLEIGEYFKYGPNMDEAIRLRTFPMSLCGEAKIWYQELEPYV